MYLKIIKLMNYKFSKPMIELNDKILNKKITKEDLIIINYHIIFMNLNIKHDL